MLVCLQPRQRRTSPRHLCGATPARRSRSGLGGVCVALKAPSRRAGPALPCQRRARGAAEPGGLGGSSARPGDQSGGGRGAGRGGGARGARGAALGERRRPAESGRTGQGRARPRREAQLRPRLCDGPAAPRRPGPARRRAGREQRGGGRGAEAASPARPARPPRALPSPPSPRRASSSRSSRLLSSAARRSRPRQGRRTQPGRAPRLARYRPGPAGTGPAPAAAPPQGPEGFRTFPTVD